MNQLHLAPLICALALAAACAGGPDSADGPRPHGADDGADGGADAATEVPPAPPPLDGRLTIAAFFQPLPSQTKATTYGDMARFGLDQIFAINTDGKLASNAPMLEAAAKNGIQLIVRDERTGFGPAPSLAAIDAMVSTYSGMAGLGGYYVRDEPLGSEIPAYAQAHRRLLARDPVHTANYLNLFPTSAPEAWFIVPRAAAVSQTGLGAGTFVTPATPLAQTFRTSSTQRTIDAITLQLDAAQWSDESLTLALYDGATRIASRTMRETNNGNYPMFVLHASIEPSHAYRWVLTHDGGGDASVGWVGLSTSDLYANGAAFVGTTMSGADFFFQLHEAQPDARTTAQHQAGSGDFVTPLTPLGQTFVVPVDAAAPLRSIELQIDPRTWSAGEVLSVTIWDSPARRTALGRASLSSSNNGYFPRWDFVTRLAAGRTYYLELTHDGGGDQSVGWVAFSSADADPATQGHRGGVPQPWDLAYRAFYGLGLYDLMVDTWLTEGAPRTLIFDNYPFRQSSDASDYFWNLALVRDRALARRTPFMGYVQSVRWEGVRAPTASELRWNAFTTLAFGASGIAYFTYWDPVFAGIAFDHALVNSDGTHGDLFEPGAVLNRELHALGRVLGSARSDGVFVSGPSIPAGLGQLPLDAPVQVKSAGAWLTGLFTLPDGRRAALVVNLDYRAPASLAMAWTTPPRRLLAVSPIDGSLADPPDYDAARGELRGSFAAGDARLLVWSP